MVSIIMSSYKYNECQLYTVDNFWATLHGAVVIRNSKVMIVPRVN